MIVVDTNVVAYCYVHSEMTPLAQRVRLRDPAWHVPILWRSELRSTLCGYIGRGTLEVDDAAAIMFAAEAALSGCEHAVVSRAVLEIAASSGLSAYDCEFVALAQSLGVPLVTEDRAILKAFPDLALSMEEFLEDFPDVPPAAHEKRQRYRSPSRFGQERLARYLELQARIDATPPPKGRRKGPISRDALYRKR